MSLFSVNTKLSELFRYVNAMRTYRWYKFQLRALTDGYCELIIQKLATFTFCAKLCNISSFTFYRISTVVARPKLTASVKLMSKV